MKKFLLATTMLASAATVASAETGVSLSGYGRFGLEYVEDRAGKVARDENNNLYTKDGVDVQLHTRLRFNIDATTETDTGITFGGRIRLQSDNRASYYAIASVTEGAGDQDLTGASAAFRNGGFINAAKLYATYEGFRVEVGNTDTAYDSAALMYDPEMGFMDSSFGDPQGDFYSYDSAPYNHGRMGVFVSYGLDNMNFRFSYVNPDQEDTDANEEIGISGDYTSGPFTVSLAAVMDGSGIKNNDQFFIGAAYKINDVANVGLNYFDEGDYTTTTRSIDPVTKLPVTSVVDTDLGSTITLYGNYTMGATTLRAYVANNSNEANDSDTSYGLGADYDMGGARLSGSIQKGYSREMVADLGVRFDF